MPFRDKGGRFAPTVFSKQKGSEGIALDPGRFKGNVFTEGHYGSGVGIQGLREAERMILAIGGRLNDAAAASLQIFPMLEAEYGRRFDRWYPRMYDTGDLRASLTEHGAYGAVREAHFDQIIFGTSIPYAKFHWRRLLTHSGGLDDKIAIAMANYYVPIGSGGASDSLSHGLPSGSFGGMFSRMMDNDDDEGDDE